MIHLDHKVTIITGGSRGIGAATARLFAKAGSHLVINCVNGRHDLEPLMSEIREYGSQIVVHRGDLSKAQNAQELVELAYNMFGRIDIVVNNAGIWTYGEIGNLSEDIWNETIAINLSSAYRVTNAAVPYMKRNGGGRIINISSTAGQRGEAYHSHYAASKGGLLAFTRSLAMELAADNILVNAVAPGWVDTELNAVLFSDPEAKRKIEQSIPLRRIATPEDVAGAILFLASDFAQYITGATINVNGGSVLA